MSHELFVIDRKPKLDEKEQGRVTYLRDQLSTAKYLGLKAQVASLKADIATVECGRLITTAPLTDAELTIWRAWLPTAYTDVGDDRHHQLANYHFDRIPQPVLKCWQKHKKAGLFERFEIWTPENHKPDPILVGVNGNARHLLARWGESDANLVSFDDIKRELVRRWYKDEPIGNEEFKERWARSERTMIAVLATMFVTIFTFLVSVFALSFLVDSPKVGIPVAGMIATAIAITTFIYVRRWITNELLRSSALMQAIAKDDSVQRELLPATT